MVVVFVAVPLVLHFDRGCHRLRRSQEFHHDNVPCVPRLGGIALVAAFVVLELVITLFFSEESSLRDAVVLVSASFGMFGLGMWTT